MRIRGFVGGAVLACVAAVTATALTTEEQQTIAAYDRVSAAVVMVICRSIDLRTGDEYVSVGSGFVLDEGHVVTAFHVIENATEINVVAQDDKAYPVSMVGTAPSLDVALLQLPSTIPSMPVAPLGSGVGLRVGQRVLAIGSPFGTEISVTTGIISGLGREFFENDIERQLIQFDASINPGQSGGPLVDSDGRVVGVIIAKTGDGEAMGFASPIDRVLEVVPDLIRMGHPFRAEIGVQGIDVTDELASLFDVGVRSGFLIEGVEPNSPAEAAGLESGNRVVEMGNRVHVLGGDIILAADDIQITGGHDLARFFSHLKAGSKVQLLVVRNGEKRTVELNIPRMNHWNNMPSEEPGSH